jgi:hypothetical protein
MEEVTIDWRVQQSKMDYLKWFYRSKTIITCVVVCYPNYNDSFKVIRPKCRLKSYIVWLNTSPDPFSILENKSPLNSDCLICCHFGYVMMLIAAFLQITSNDITS